MMNLMSLTMVGLGTYELWIAYDLRHLLQVPNGSGMLLGILIALGAFTIYLGANAMYEDYNE